MIIRGRNQNFLERMKENKTNEFTIQNALYAYLTKKAHQYIIPNIYIGHLESDMISVTKAGFIHEYEIKLNLQDFKADFKKSKHAHMRNRHRQFRNYFWFVAPAGLIDTNDVPEYAGHIEIYDRREVFSGGSLGNIVCAEPKRPKRLHNRKISLRQKAEIAGKLEVRYWRMRKKIQNERQKRMF